jgi:EmrB/QacA subfamily drug resistance transporter
METPARRTALIVIATAQLMVALDATIVNIALPTVQRALRFSDADRQWVVTAYTVALAGSLLLGGRLADRVGHRRAFLGGMTGFAAASALAGTAPNFGVLVTGRALQGAFAALVIPSALALLAAVFTAPAERARAFGVYGAVASSGAATGLLLGGVLTEYVSWRWCLYLNLAVGAAALGVGRRVLPRTQGHSSGGLPDIAGAVLGAGGLVALVLGCSQAALDGWSAPPVVALLLVGTFSLGGFLLRQRWARSPLIPPQILFNLPRAGTYLAIAAAIVGSFGAFLVLTYYLQVVRGYSPIRTGLAFLPMTGAVAVSATLVAGRLMPRLPPRALIVPGLLAAAAGLAWLTRLEVASPYLTGVLPAELLLGAGMGCIITPGFQFATSHGIRPQHAGVAAATAQTANQVGGSLGTALLNTLATASAAGSRPAALVHGYTVAAGAAALLLIVAAVVAGTTIRVPAESSRAPAESSRVPAEEI